MSTVLKTAMIYDGTGSDAFIGDVLIEGDRIISVGSGLAGDNVVDIKGYSLSSGFIDAHSHNDWFAVKKDANKYFEPFLRQGITTFVCGNCGLSHIGFSDDTANKDIIGGGLFNMQGTTGEYGNAKEFFNAIDKNTPLNIATFVGHCTARASVGGRKKDLSEKELKEMLAILEENLKQGACGVSLGLMYDPGMYAPTSELREVAKLCEKYGKVLSVHPRANSSISMAYPQLLGRSHILRALDELVEVTAGLKVKLQYSHAIFVGTSSFKSHIELVAMLEKLKADGVDAMFDIYSEEMGVSVITVIMPTWYQAMDKKEKNKFFNKFKYTALTNITKKLLGFGFDDIQIAYLGEGNEQFEGKTVHEIAKELHVKDIDAYAYLCELSEDKGRVNMGPYSTPEIISKLSKHPQVLYMTDAWVEEKGVQNMAIYDCFPKFLQLSLQGKGDSFANTIRKMTGATADRFGLQERGYIKEGAFADITIFSEEELLNGKVDINKPFGIKSVFVNGSKIYDEGIIADVEFSKSGRAIKC